MSTIDHSAQPTLLHTPPPPQRATLHLQYKSEPDPSSWSHSRDHHTFLHVWLGQLDMSQVWSPCESMFQVILLQLWSVFIKCVDKMYKYKMYNPRPTGGATIVRNFFAKVCSRTNNCIIMFGWDEESGQETRKKTTFILIVPQRGEKFCMKGRGHSQELVRRVVVPQPMTCPWRLSALPDVSLHRH